MSKMKRQVNLHVEGVPNPNAMKIVLENGVMTDTPYEFTDLDSAKDSPLARKLLMLRYVDRVMLNHNYVTIVKTASGSPEWNKILFELRSLIQQHLENDEPILYLDASALDHPHNEDAVVEMIVQVLDRKVRPAAQEDGGDIVFESYRDGVVNLNMHGACHLCPYAGQTVKQGVEKLLMHYVPEVRKVVATANRVTE